MGSVQGLKRVVDDEAQEQKVLKPKKGKQPSSDSSLLWIRIAVAFILAMAAISYFFF